MVQDPDVVTAALEQFRLHPAPGLTDCLAVEVARRAGQLPFGTFDRSLARMAGVVQL